MPLPMPLQRLARTRRFWTDFFWQTAPDDDGYPQLADCTIELALPGGYKLSLSLDEAMCYLSLGFSAPRQETVEIAWDDQAHWHPHVLRWQELELICRVIALQDDQLAHPGLVLLWLHRFAPICVGDDPDVIVPMLECAWGQLGVFSDSEIARFIERADARDAGFAWRYHEEVGGWCIEQEGERAARGLYTFRDARNKEFPFEQWARMTAAAEDFVAQARGSADHNVRTFAATGDIDLVPTLVRSLRAETHAALAGALGDGPPLPRVCWVVETLLGLPAGSLVKRHVRRRCSPRAKHALYLTLPLRDAERPLPSAAGKLVRDTLDRILKDLNLGEADPSGATSTTAEDGSHVYLEHSLFVRIDGDLDRGLRMLREVLWWAGAPQSVRLTDAGHKPVALDLAHPPDESGERYLQISKLRTVHWNFAGDRGHRFDRVPLDRQCRTALRSVLRDAGASNADADGWFDVALADGGSMRVCLQRIDDDPNLDGGTIVVRHLSAEAAGLLYRLLSEGELLILPMAVAASAAAAKTVAAPWPVVRVVASPAELERMLRRGPRDWWLHRGGERPA